MSTADLTHRTVPPALVGAASRWAGELLPGLTWLLAPPGAGKSTWLQALALAAPEVGAVDLGLLAGARLRCDGSTPGGLQQFLRLAREVRDACLADPKRRYVAAAALLPDELVPAVDAGNESIVLLRPVPAALLRQRERPLSRPHAVECGEILRIEAWHTALRRRRPDLTVVEPPFLSELAGARPASVSRSS